MAKKPLKVHCTAHRLYLRTLTWDKVQELARQVINTSPPGEMSRMARELGITDSQIHRYTCESCEHDQEPLFTIGFALLAYCLKRLSTTEILTHPSPFKQSFGKAKGGSGRVRNYPQSTEATQAMY